MSPFSRWDLPLRRKKGLATRSLVAIVLANKTGNREIVQQYLPDGAEIVLPGSFV